MIDPSALDRLLPALAAEGYQVVSVSGGEPFLYPHLHRLALTARSCDMRINAVTNGTVRIPSWVLRDPSSLDVVAVSLDGPADRHDALRGRLGAFERALRTLRTLRSNGVRTAVVSCVTRESLPDVPDLYEVCQAEGVELLRLHPLAKVGRGVELFDGGLGLGPSHLRRLRVVAEMLSTLGGPAVVADVPFSGELRSFFREADAHRQGTGRVRLADVINPLVVREDGEMLPFAYGLPQRFSLGRIESLPGASRQEIQERCDPAVSLFRSAVARLPEADDVCLDWEAQLQACAPENLRVSPRRLAPPDPGRPRASDLHGVVHQRVAQTSDEPVAEDA